MLSSCSLVSLSYPPKLPGPQTPVSIYAKSPPRSDVRIDYDVHGIPHIEAADERSLSYGLGFAHARDRLFQLHFRRMAALGRLTELYGPLALNTDRQLRFLSYQLDEAALSLSPRDRSLIEAYIAGVDAGAEHAGRGAELFFFGEPWRSLRVKDVIAMMRLRAFQMAHDFRAELAQERIRSRLSPSDDRLPLLLIDVPGAGTEVLRDLKRSKVPASSAPDKDLSGKSSRAFAPTKESEQSDQAFAFLFERHASNAWAISGELSSEGRPILTADPHGPHRAPSRFYLAHLKTKDGINAIGATIVGDIGLPLGFSENLAWSETSSYVNTQDLVALRTDSNDPRRYTREEGNDKTIAFKTHDEAFLYQGKPLLTERFRDTQFGPVVPEGYSQYIEAGHLYALTWTGFSPEATSRNIGGAFDLMRARNLEQAKDALARMKLPSRNMLLATQDSIASLLSGALLNEQDPSPLAIQNPAAGLLVSANQRLTGDPALTPLTGTFAASPYRAQRIREALRESLDQQKLNAERSLAIQLDSISIEARRLAPLLASRCPSRVQGQSPKLVNDFCSVLKNFDGAFTTNAVGALPFLKLYRALKIEVLSTHVGADIALELVEQPFLAAAIERAIILEVEGKPSPLFDDPQTPLHDGLDYFVSRATYKVLADLSDAGLTTPASWRWSENHRANFDGPLSTQTLLKGVFKNDSLPLAGTEHAPQSESGSPVASGANLRFSVSMTSPPRGGLILDLGQSGHFAHPNYDDQQKLWMKGQVLPLSLLTSSKSPEIQRSLILKAR